MLRLIAVAVGLVSACQAQGLLLFNARVPTSAQDALTLFDTSTRNGDVFQTQQALEWMSSRYSEVLASQYLTRLNSYAIAQLLAQPWVIDEIEVFRAAKRWLETTRTPAGEQRNAILANVRLAALTLDQISDEVVPSDLFNCKRTTEALVLKARGNVSSLYLRFPNQLATEDVVTSKLQAKIVDSVVNVSSACNGRNPLLERCTGLHQNVNCSVSVNFTQSVTFELGAPFLLNTVRLHTSEDRLCYFYVDSSLNKQTWKRVSADTSSGLRATRFDEQKIRYFRIGTTAQCFMNDARFPNFVVKSFEALYA